ncbi:MAG: tripartite tricarboxylate transporter substrate-binding protein [Pseudomonadota bacterium]
MGRISGLTSLLLCFVAGNAVAQNYPAKPVTLIVPYAAGGPTDVVARALASALANTLKSPVEVVNVGGAGGTYGALKVAKSAPDGYTLLLNHIGQATAAALYPKLTYDPVGDFEPIGLIVNVPMTVIARSSLGASNFKELSTYLTQAKAVAKIGNAGIGSASHLCGLQLLSRLNLATQTIPFKGTGPAMASLQAGNIDVMCDQVTNTMGEVKASKVKVYGVTTHKRIDALPSVPTLDESGLQGFEVIVWHGLYAPKGTPKPIIDKLTATLQLSLKEPAFKTHMAELGADIVPADGARPEALRALLKSESGKWTQIIKKAGVYAE